MKRLIIFFVIIPILGMDKENWQLQLGKGIISDDCELVESVCKTGADVNYTLDYACSFLHLASWHAGPKIVKILIEYRADLDKETEEGYSPLDTAIFRGKLTNIEALLHHGAKLKKKSLYYWAIANQVESLVIPKVLIAHGALIENEYSSPFYEHLKETISRRRFIDFEYVFDIVCFFLEHGADPNRNVDSVKELVESDFFKGLSLN